MAHAAHVAVAKLTRHDLERSQIWEYCLELEGTSGIDESTVRPVDTPRDDSELLTQYLVSATYTLKHGQEFPGVVLVEMLGKKKHLEPEFIFLLDRHLAPVSMETERLLAKYTNHPGNRPTRWKLDVPLPGESRKRTGTIRRGLGFSLASLIIRLAMSRMKRGQGKARGEV